MTTLLKFQAAYFRSSDDVRSRRCAVQAIELHSINIPLRFSAGTKFLVSSGCRQYSHAKVGPRRCCGLTKCMSDSNMHIDSVFGNESERRCQISVQNDGGDLLWQAIREEAQEDSMKEPILASYLYATILAHKSLEDSLAFHAAYKLAGPTSPFSDSFTQPFSFTQLLLLFSDIFNGDEGIKEAIRADICAFRARDPACTSYLQCILFFKGFLACQIYRAAHKLWIQGRTTLAMAIQNRVAEVFQVDIHPGATIGKGILFDHATGVVIGETASVGDNVSILHHVTLGGTGSHGGDRHPKVMQGVLIGAGATLLGPIRVGSRARIGASSLVTVDVPDYCTAVGVPARIIVPNQTGSVVGVRKDPPGKTMDHATFIT